jgi:hypothetical protein
MNNENDNGSLKQVALPAQGQCWRCKGTGKVSHLNQQWRCYECNGAGRGSSRGGSDSRSETLSPREWPTLEPALCYLKSVREGVDWSADFPLQEHLWDAINGLQKAVDYQRSRRPRGESGRLSDGRRAT